MVRSFSSIAQLIGVVWILSSTAFAQAGPGVFLESEEKSAIAGVVVRATTAEPIPRATVTLTRVMTPTGPAGGPNSPGARGGGGPQPPQGQPARQPFIVTATTGPDGTFEFKDLDAGPYRLVAVRNGYSRQEFGQRTFNRPGTVMNLRAGQTVNDVTFKLMPAATISGRVLDSNGEPQAGVTIQALRSTYDATGKRTLQPVASARSNDLGEYRLYWINPGRYFITANAARSALDLITSGASQAASQAASPQEAMAASQAAAMFGPASNPNEAPDTSLGLTYYPGTPDASRALGVDLKPGEEIRAIDFNLMRTQRVRVSGNVVDVETGRPPQMAQVSVSLRDSVSSSLEALIGMSDPAGVRYDNQTGEFTLQNIAPGSYWLQVMAQAGAAPGVDPNAPPATPQDAMAALASIRTARIPIEVSGFDVDDVTLTVGAGVAVPGRLRIEGAQAESQNPGAFTVSLQSASGGLDILAMLAGAPPRPAADGTFSIPRVNPGDYRVTVGGMGINFYLKDVRYQQTDILESGLTVASPFNGGLDITLGMNPGQLSGNVTDATMKPVSGIQAVLIPDRKRSRQDLYKTATTDQDGRFTLRGITPGDYLMFAWEDIEPFSYYDPSVLARYEQQGKRVRIAEGASEIAELKLIPATP